MNVLAKKAQYNTMFESISGGIYRTNLYKIFRIITM